MHPHHVPSTLTHAHTQTHTLIKLLHYYTNAPTQINIKLTSSRFAAHRRRLWRRRPGPRRVSLDRASHREERGYVRPRRRRSTESQKMARKKMSPTHIHMQSLNHNSQKHIIHSH